MARDIYIHAGAHRTGTSSFQMCLHANRKALQEAGFAAAYPGRDGIPSGKLALKLPAPRHGPRKIAKLAERLDRQFANLDKPLILSEENIPGRMFHFLFAKFYPAAEARLQTLRQGFANDRIARVLFVVRPYDQLYVSSFRKRAEDVRSRPFDAFRSALMSMDRGWPELVTAMRDILKPEELVIATYGARGTSSELLRRLVPDLDIPLKEPARTMNLSATDAALEELQARYHAGEKLKRAEWKAVIERHADDKTSRGFAEFTPGEARQLQDRYAADLERIAAIPGITFVL